MQLFGDRITAPKTLMISEIMVNGSCWFITLERALFLRKGETLWLDDAQAFGVPVPQPVVERLDGTTVRPKSTWATVKWAYKLL